MHVVHWVSTPLTDGRAPRSMSTHISLSCMCRSLAVYSRSLCNVHVCIPLTEWLHSLSESLRNMPLIEWRVLLAEQWAHWAKSTVGRPAQGVIFSMCLHICIYRTSGCKRKLWNSLHSYTIQHMSVSSIDTHNCQSTAKCQWFANDDILTFWHTHFQC